MTMWQEKKKRARDIKTMQRIVFLNKWLPTPVLVLILIISLLARVF